MAAAVRSYGFGVRENVARQRPFCSGGPDCAHRARRREGARRREDSLRCPAGVPDQRDSLPFINSRGRPAWAALEREPHAHTRSPAYTLVHTCTLRPTRQRPSCPWWWLRLLAPSRGAELPDPATAHSPPGGEGDARSEPAVGRGAPGCPGQGSARSVGARVRRDRQRPPGSGKLQAGPDQAQGAEGRVGAAVASPDS